MDILITVSCIKFFRHFLPKGHALNKPIYCNLIGAAAQVNALFVSRPNSAQRIMVWHLYRLLHSP